MKLLTKVGNKYHARSASDILDYLDLQKLGNRERTFVNSMFVWAVRNVFFTEKQGNYLHDLVKKYRKFPLTDTEDDPAIIERDRLRALEYEKKLIHQTELLDMYDPFRNLYGGAMNQRLKKYNLTLMEFLELWHLNEGKCHICSEPLKIHNRTYNGITTKSVIDHCHETGKVRGILCSPCNIYVGHVEKIGLDRIDSLIGTDTKLKIITDSRKTILALGYILGGFNEVMNQLRSISSYCSPITGESPIDPEFNFR